MQPNILLIILLSLFAFLLYHIAYFIGYYDCFRANRELIQRPRDFQKVIKMVTDELEKDKLKKE